MITLNAFIPLPQCCCHPEMAAICYLVPCSACSDRNVKMACIATEEGDSEVA